MGKKIIFFLLFLGFNFTHSATLYLLPESVKVNVGENLKIGVYVDSVDQTMNAFSFLIFYPKNLLKFVNFSKSGSTINLWVQEPEHNSINAQLSGEGLVLNPGFQGKRAKVVEINFQALKEGEAKIEFLKGMVLANDGQGTNILSSMKGGSYRILAQKVEVPEKTSLNLPPKPIIFSPTHPNENAWYNNNNPIFTWNVPKEVDVVRTGYERNADLMPLVEYLSPISRRELKGISDGIYYFAVQFGNKAGWGPIARYKFQIDTVPPQITNFSLLSKGSVVEVKISAVDSLSGIDKIEIYIDDALYKSDIFDKDYPLIIPGLIGEHQIKVIVKDKAGNQDFKEQKIDVKSIFKPEAKPEIKKDYSSYLLILLIFFLLLLLIVLLILIRCLIYLKKTHQEIKKLDLEKLKKDTKNKLNEFLKEMKEEIRMLDENPNFNETERNIYRRFKEIIEKAEKEIEDELNKE
jgi:hypothetical protein